MGDILGISGRGSVDIVANGRLSVDGRDTEEDGGVMWVEGRYSTCPGEETACECSRWKDMWRDGSRLLRPSRLNSIFGKRTCERPKGGIHPLGAGVGGVFDNVTGMSALGGTSSYADDSGSLIVGSGSGDSRGTGTREGGARTRSALGSHCSFAPFSMDRSRAWPAFSFFGGNGGSPSTPATRRGMCASGSFAYERMNICCLAGLSGN